MTAAFGNILTYLLNHIKESETKIDFESMISHFSKEMCKSILLSKNWKETFTIIQEHFKDVILPDLIPCVKLLIHEKDNPKSKIAIIAFVIFGYYVIQKVSTLEQQINEWNQKLDELLELTKASYITPDSLLERGIWILNFKRMEKLMQNKIESIQAYYKEKQINQFNNYWYNIMKQKDNTNKMLNNIINAQRKQIRNQLNYDQLVIELKSLKEEIKNRIYGKKTNKTRIKLYIMNRKIRKIQKIINRITEIQKHNESLSEELEDLIEAKFLQNLKEAIDNIDKETMEFVNKNTETPTFKSELKFYERIWTEMKLNPIKKTAEKLNLQFNYLINLLESENEVIDENVEEEEISTNEEEKRKEKDPKPKRKISV